jgi:hypothetical protein
MTNISSPFSVSRAEELLEFLDALGHGRLGGVQPVGRGPEAAELHDPVERFELLESHHGKGLFTAECARGAHALRALH